MSFAKYHGCQNDFLVFTDTEVSAEDAQRLCRRHAGVGADGIALVGVGVALPTMRIINADGSRPEMCGNALRCVVKHLVDRKLVADSGKVSVMTDSGVLSATYVRDDDGRVSEVTVDMGPLRSDVEARTLLMPVGRRLNGYSVSMGNPHFVALSERPMHDAKELGRDVATHLDFPEGVNASFMRLIDEQTVEAVVYERGAGLTMACGTGACAIAAVGRHLRLLADTEVSVQLPGGALAIGLDPSGHLLMRGPATWVFDGTSALR